MPDITTRCCIAGGGPAGMMLGLLLARAGIDVVVLEKHADFLRDFRGDTVHPSTMQVMHELGLLDAFLARPHSEVRTLAGQIGDDYVQVADFTHLPTRCKFVAFMPQWDFLDFLAERGEALSDVPAADADRGHRPDPRRRPHGRRVGKWSRRCAGDRRRTGHRRRWTALHVARCRRFRGRRSRRADGCAVAAPVKVAERSGADARPHRRRPHLHHAGPRRLLAMRLRHPEGRHRRGARARARSVPRRDRAARALPARPGA